VLGPIVEAGPVDVVDEGFGRHVLGEDSPLSTLAPTPVGLLRFVAAAQAQERIQECCSGARFQKNGLASSLIRPAVLNQRGLARPGTPSVGAVCRAATDRSRRSNDISRLVEKRSNDRGLLESSTRAAAVETEGVEDPLALLVRPGAP